MFPSVKPLARNSSRSRGKRAGAKLDRLSRKPLADHVELVEAGVVQGHRAALPLVHDLDLEAEDIAKLALEREQVGVDGFRRLPSAPSSDGIGTSRLSP